MEKHRAVTIRAGDLTIYSEDQCDVFEWRPLVVDRHLLILDGD
jgi:hypothetical protein